MPGIVAGIVLVFIPSIGQFVVSDLLGGAKSILAGNLIQNQFAVARNKPFGSAIAFELTAVVLVLLFAYAMYTKTQGAGGAAVSASRAPKLRGSSSSRVRSAVWRAVAAPGAAGLLGAPAPRAAQPAGLPLSLRARSSS